MQRQELKDDIQKNELKISISGTKKRVKLSDYVYAKTKSLIEFGYSGLTEIEVMQQIEYISDDDITNVIGMMIEDDLDY